MSVNFPFKVHAPDGTPVGATLHAEDAAGLVYLHGDGATVRYRNTVVYTQGPDGDAGNSYDAAAGLMYQRVDAQDKARAARRDAMNALLRGKHGMTVREVRS
jgi:hypothetical protein